jgi:hypothetical protein
MLKNISKLGKTLSNKEQQTINGGKGTDPVLCTPNFISTSANPSNGEPCSYGGASGTVLNGLCCF